VWNALTGNEVITANTMVAEPEPAPAPISVAPLSRSIGSERPTEGPYRFVTEDAQDEGPVVTLLQAPAYDPDAEDDKEADDQDQKAREAGSSAEGAAQKNTGDGEEEKGEEKTEDKQYPGADVTKVGSDERVRTDTINYTEIIKRLENSHNEKNPTTILE